MLNASQRNSSFFASLIANVLEIFRSQLFTSTAHRVLRPTVAPVGSPVGIAIKRTSVGWTQVPVSGLRYPVDAHRVVSGTARVFTGALGLPMSGRSFARPSPLRSRPLAGLNGAPDWNVVMPATDQPPKRCFQGPLFGSGISH